MNSPEPRRRKAAAIAATVVFHALLIAALMAGVTSQREFIKACSEVVLNSTPL